MREREREREREGEREKAISKGKLTFLQQKSTPPKKKNLQQITADTTNLQPLEENKQREATGRKGEGGLGGGGGLSAAPDVGRRLRNKHPHPNSPSLHLPRTPEGERERERERKGKNKINRTCAKNVGFDFLGFPSTLADVLRKCGISKGNCHSSPRLLGNPRKFDHRQMIISGLLRNFP